MLPSFLLVSSIAWKQRVAMATTRLLSSSGDFLKKKNPFHSVFNFSFFSPFSGGGGGGVCSRPRVCVCECVGVFVRALLSEAPIVLGLHCRSRDGESGVFFYRVLRGFTEFYCVIPGFNGFHRVLFWV